VLVSPMVTWIWLGAIVVLLGALIALWPSPRTVSRRVTAAYAARVGREARVPA
jgi:cytochrome c-type biogenesis protein CcmF